MKDHNLRIWSWFMKQIANHYFWSIDQLKFVTCSSALYSSNGVWSLFLLAAMSQIYAFESSPTEQICTQDCGAHAIAFTLSLWFLNLSIGTDGFLHKIIQLPDIHDCNVVLLHFDKRQHMMTGLLSVPCEFQNGSGFLCLIKHWTMLKVPKIKLSNWTISSSWCKNISFTGKMNIINLFVVRNELSKNRFLLNVPNSACSIYRAGTD